MDFKTLAIPFAFILLAATLAYIVAALPTDWRRKVPLVVVVPLFGLAVWAAIGSYRGWPTGDSMPDQVQLLWSVVDEPNPKSGTSGNIFIWGVPLAVEKVDHGLFEYKYAQGEPRAYRLPYSRNMHEMLEAAREKLANGNPVMLKRRPRTETEGD